MGVIAEVSGKNEVTERCDAKLRVGMACLTALPGSLALLCPLITSKDVSYYHFQPEIRRLSF